MCHCSWGCLVIPSTVSWVMWFTDRRTGQSDHGDVRCLSTSTDVERQKGGPPRITPWLWLPLIGQDPQPEEMTSRKWNQCDFFESFSAYHYFSLFPLSLRTQKVRGLLSPLPNSQSGVLGSGDCCLLLNQGTLLCSDIRLGSSYWKEVKRVKKRSARPCSCPEGTPFISLAAQSQSNSIHGYVHASQLGLLLQVVFCIEILGQAAYCPNSKTNLGWKSLNLRLNPDRCRKYKMDPFIF